MSINVGDVFVIERKYILTGRVNHRWEMEVVRVTAKRAYFGDRTWFALDDPARVVKPRYCDYTTTATPKGEVAS